jgi:hypothetical protein
MCFGNINDQESNAASILLVKLVEGGYLPSERRSCVTAEHQHDRLPLVERGEPNTVALVYLEQ